MPTTLTQTELLRELDQVVVGELNRHEKVAKEWFPHEYVPWSEGRNFDGLMGGDAWTEQDSGVSDVARSALMRQESRGGHTRIDYEGERDEWVKVNIVIRRGKDGEMEVEQVTRPEPVPYLKAIANAKIEDLESGAVGADAPND